MKVNITFPTPFELVSGMPGQGALGARHVALQVGLLAPRVRAAPGVF